MTYHTYSKPYLILSSGMDHHQFIIPRLISLPADVAFCQWSQPFDGSVADQRLNYYVRSGYCHQPTVNNQTFAYGHLPVYNMVFNANENLINETNNRLMTSNKSINGIWKKNKNEIPSREWQDRVSLTRKSSNDSGIAESPKSISSSVGFKSFDELALSSDECKSTGALEATAVKENCEKRLLHQDAGKKIVCNRCDDCVWTIEDDNAFLKSVGRQVPSKNVINSVVDQVEYYLSDEYLLKDKYLVRQIRCKKDGYVSIKLISSFKKVKKLNKDWTVVRTAIVRKSKNIVISSDGLRLKRKKELTGILRQPRALTSVLVIRLPKEYNSVPVITRLFRGFGEIGCVRLLRTDKSIPSDLRNYATQVPDIGKSLCAVIDFEFAENALKSVRLLKFFQRKTFVSDEESLLDNDHQEEIQNILKDLPDLGDMRLGLLGPRIKRTLYRQDRLLKDGFNAFYRQQDLKKQSNWKEQTEEIKTSSDEASEAKLCGRKKFSLTSFHNVVVIRQPRGPCEAENFFTRKKLTQRD